MNKKYKHIYFKKLKRFKRKTDVWECHHNESDLYLGDVKWHSHWRQYCFNPYYDTVFSRGCLNDITNFIEQLMEERKCQKKQ